MRWHVASILVVAVMFSAAAVADPIVTFTLSSVKDGQTVGQKMPIRWQITLTASSGDNAGLALASVDLEQGGSNPVFFDIPPADGVPSGMSNFSRPAGIANPGETDPNTGYIGVQRGTVGQKNLVQIGGGQNTFGEALPSGTGIGENAVVVGGVAQGGAQLLATGLFSAPQTPGLYTFSLQNGLANVVTTVNPPPTFSPVAAATVQYSPQSMSFTVGNYAIADTNCDGSINGLDIDAFVLALTDPSGYSTQYPSCDRMLADCNGDASVNGLDVDAFVDQFVGG